ncbi:MAG: DUF6089 family protein [Bacteroidales bacterium]
MKKLVTLLVLILVTTVMYGQRLDRRHEIGAFGGVSYYNGDLNENTFIGEMSPAFGIVYRYLINDRWALRIHGLRGTVSADDANNKKEWQSRNLMFKSSITEFSAIMELNFLPYVPGSKDHRFTPYLFGGIGIFSFNPMAKYEGPWTRITSGEPYDGWYELQPLGTEGQGSTEYDDRKPYALTQVSLPFGLGIKWNVSPSFSLGLEWGYRKTFTDYIDDVSTTYVEPSMLKSENTEISMILANRSFEIEGVEEYGNQYPEAAAAAMVGEQRGNSETNDWYSFLGITLSFNIKGPNTEPCPAYRDYNKYKDYYLF